MSTLGIRSRISVSMSCEYVALAWSLPAWEAKLGLRYIFYRNLASSIPLRLDLVLKSLIHFEKNEHFVYYVA